VAAAALLTRGQGLWWILLAAAIGVAIVPVTWRRKAAIAPGARFASSADYILAEARRGQVPGELSFTARGIHWAPSKDSAAKGFLPLSFAIGECAPVSMRAGPALLDVVITVRRRSGGEWSFLTHRRTGLRSAVTEFNDSIL
jgi:hypothetical protein